MPTPRPTATKRKSVLSELGIKPGGGGGEPVKTPTPKTPTSPSTTMTRKNSVNTSPSVSRTRSVTTKPKLDRTTSNSSANSPTSPSPRRRSIVPTTSNQRPSISPLARKASTSVSSRRVTSPEALDSLQEEQLNEKDQEIKRLKTIELESATKISALEIELEKLREELKLSLEKNKEVIVESKEIDDNMKELLIQETEDKLKETENKLQERHKSEMENLLDQQDKKLDAELAILKIDLSAQYDEELRTFKLEHENRLQHLTSEHEARYQHLKSGYLDELQQMKNEIQASNDEKESVILNTKKQLQDIQANVQKELESAFTELNNFKKTSQQEKEALENKYKEEIRQLQLGTDDATNVWIDKARSAEEELSNLKDKLQQKDEEHQNTIQSLKDAHVKESKQLQDTCNEKESQIEAQSKQIQELTQQVESYKNSSEANTIPNTSDQENHQDCLNKLDAKQKEINDLRAGLTIPQDEDRLIRIAKQHRTELKQMHIQYQKVVDAKNRELEDYAYRVKAIVAAKQKDIEKLEIDTTHTIQTLETKMEGFEKECNKLTERVAHWEMLAQNNEAIIMDMKRECAVHQHENTQLNKLVGQLQSEIQHR